MSWNSLFFPSYHYLGLLASIFIAEVARHVWFRQFVHDVTVADLKFAGFQSEPV